MKIGYFQFLPEFLKIRNNLKEIERLLKKNEEYIKNLDLVVFPEYFLSGPFKIDFIKNYEQEISSEEIIISLKNISKIFSKTAFVMGSFLLKQNGKYVNSCIVVNNGEELVRYNKKALIYNENYICQSDNKKAVFNIGKIKIGLAICWDLILPEVFRMYTKEVDLVVVPSFWGVAGNALQAQYSFSLEKKYYTALGVSRAYENSFALLFVNSVGKYKSSFYSDRMMGGSYFVNPPLGIIHKTNSKDYQKLHIINFNLDPLNQYREYYATDKDYLYYKSKKVI
ncbi:MAG: carbon-nitrogen hydrolase family protein [Patescibacteria group bacterium]|nr:carbon-nitrogen hydrolase family protein [Patescibacteria group bacterium]